MTKTLQVNFSFKGKYVRGAARLLHNKAHELAKKTFEGEMNTVFEQVAKYADEAQVDDISMSRGFIEDLYAKFLKSYESKLSQIVTVEGLDVESLNDDQRASLSIIGSSKDYTRDLVKHQDYQGVIQQGIVHLEALSELNKGLEVKVEAKYEDKVNAPSEDKSLILQAFEEVNDIEKHLGAEEFTLKVNKRNIVITKTGYKLIIHLV